MKKNVYTGEYLRAVSFPLGGIGTGSVGLSGNGSLIDWEIYNRPNKHTCNGFTNFAVKAEKDEKILDSRLLKGDTYNDFEGGYSSSFSNAGFGHGVSRNFLAGLAHFRNVSFTGNYPVAEINYKDTQFPGIVKMNAFNPFIPINDRDSSIPCAFFEFEIENNTDSDINYTLAFSIGNPFEHNTVNSYEEKNGLHFIKMSSAEYKNPNDIKYGNAVIATDSPDVSYQEYWYRSTWFDDVTTFRREFRQYGKLKNRKYVQGDKNIKDMCTLASHIKIKAGKTGKVKFIFSWYFPNFYKYWASNEAKLLNKYILKGRQKLQWKNYYATIFSSSGAVAEYCLKNFTRLRNDTFLFRDALLSTSVPDEVYDAVQGTISVLKSSACIRLEDGSFYAFEGTSAKAGSCEGTCDHVWGYAYAMPFLFPQLERSIRHTTYTNNLTKNGAVVFRTMLPYKTVTRPLHSAAKDFRPCCDAQFGNIIKFYRDWKICGDDNFLKEHWPYIRKSLEFAWSKMNPFRWDPNKKGVIEGRQHHTLDVELFGPVSWLSGYYVGALFAAAEMAEHLGETDKAEEYRSIAEKGKIYMDTRLFNGSHYIQKIDLKDKSVPDSFGCSSYYWNNETEEIKYQIQDGCEIDQVVADWHTKLCGLPEVFYPEHRKSALKAIYNLNFKSMRDISNPCRSFAVDDEKGVVMCEWNEKDKKPSISIPYTEEVMTGFEYAAADTMLQNGMEKEALEIVKAVRRRYDGKKRNPWSEIECGSNYARSMSSYSFILTYSGFSFDMINSHIGFDPIHWGNGYSTFWAIEGAFGTFSFDGSIITFKVLYGKTALVSLGLPRAVNKSEKCMLCGRDIPFRFDGNALYANINMNAGDTLYIYTEKCQPQTTI